MNRREFLCGAGAAGAAALFPGGTARAAASALNRDIGKETSMHVGDMLWKTSEQNLRFYARHGVKHITANHPPGMVPPDYSDVDTLVKFREQVESHGISLDMLMLPWRLTWATIHFDEAAERDRKIDMACELVRRTAQAGVPGLLYTLSLLGVLRTGTTPGRGGCSYSTWNYQEALQDPSVAHEGEIPADLFWERITRFLERVIPVAQEHKVRMACHPHDPYVPGRVMGTVEGLKRFVSIAPSDYHGLLFCQGSVAEMLEDPGREIFDVIRYFGSRNKIFMVHFRNIRGGLNDFQEVYPDEGDVDMYRAVKTYKEVGFKGMLVPDHLPVHEEDPDQYQGFAFGFGYIKGLIQAANAEG